MSRYISFILYVAVSLLLIAGCTCRVKSGSGVCDFIPTDYSLPSSWYDNGKDVDDSLVDIFYVLPTCVFDSKDSVTGKILRLADLSNQDQIENMDLSYALADRIFADSANFFSPYYQQVSLDVWMDGADTVSKYAPIAMSEVQRAFDYYLEHFNNGREFVLAGFSQGGLGVVHLLKYMSDEAFDRMIAAYVCGYKVTENDVNESSHIRFAQGATDRGVTVVYNSVTSEDAISEVISSGSVACINPISWTTSEEPATDGEITVHVSKRNNVLIVEGVNPESFYHKSLETLIPYGNLHLGELTIYENSLKKNVKERSYD